MMDKRVLDMEYDSPLRLLMDDVGDHLVIRTYFGTGNLNDFIAASIAAAVKAGKPAMFRDDRGVETWFCRDSIVEERVLYMRKQRAAQPFFARTLRRIIAKGKG